MLEQKIREPNVVHDSNVAASQVPPHWPAEGLQVWLSTPSESKA